MIFYTEGDFDGIAMTLWIAMTLNICFILRTFMILKKALLCFFKPNYILSP